MRSQPRLVMVGLTHPLGQSCGDVHEVSLDTSYYLEVSVLLGTSWHHCCLSEHRACQVSYLAMVVGDSRKVHCHAFCILTPADLTKPNYKQELA